MIIKCTLSVSLESIKYYGRQFSELPPLPEYIMKKGPYVNNQEGRAHQLITIYEFDVMKFTEAWDCISKQLEPFRRIPGFTLSVCILKKGKRLKGTELAQNQRRAKPVSQISSSLE